MVALKTQRVYRRIPGSTDVPYGRCEVDSTGTDDSRLTFHAREKRYQRS